MKRFRDPELRALVEDLGDLLPELSRRVIRLSQIARARDLAIAEAAASVAGESGNVALMGRATHVMFRLLRESDEESFSSVHERVEGGVSTRELWDCWTTPRIREWLSPFATAISDGAAGVTLGRSPRGRPIQAVVYDVIPEVQLGLKCPVQPDLGTESAVGETRIQVVFEAGRKRSRMELLHAGWPVGGEWPTTIRWYRWFWAQAGQRLQRLVSSL